MGERMLWDSCIITFLHCSQESLPVGSLGSGSGVL